MVYYQNVYKGNKYSAKKKECNLGHVHDSTKEARRCDELNFLLKAKKILNLEYQKRFLIIPALTKTIETGEVYKVGEKKGQKKLKTVCEEQAVYYVADFVYFDMELNKTVIEDSKGVRTKDYILKRKLMKKLYCSDDKTIFLET